VLAAVVLGGCGHAPAPAAVPPPVFAPAPPAPVPYPVGERVLHLRRGADRPLPTLVFYPAVPGGRFPLVLFCHGLSGSAVRYARTLAGWAAAGFVVAAPTFPYTSEFTRDFRRPDIVNQPADARFVLHQVASLNQREGDPLRQRIDTDHMAAIGHSAGGYTTTGLFTAGHDPRLRAGVVMAGWAAPDAFAGPPATMLFVQGVADPVVPVAVSRAAFERVPWPKSYLLMRRISHADYLRPNQRGYAQVTATVTAFLRWTLTGDEPARMSLPPVVSPTAPDVVG